MADLEELKLKYQSVLDLAKAKNVRLDHCHIQDDKLFIDGAAPNEDLKNDVWNEIKSVDASFGDLSCELSIDSSIPLPTKTYTVVAGDSLWKIAQNELGNGALFKKLIEANPDILEDEHSVIHPGDVLVIPS
jgi:nucleoid-associated protein YgaU